jgi:hypothetical protein
VDNVRKWHRVGGQHCFVFRRVSGSSYSLTHWHSDFDAVAYSFSDAVICPDAVGYSHPDSSSDGHSDSDTDSDRDSDSDCDPVADSFAHSFADSDARSD